MKLLFVANRFPYPPFRGDKLKIYHLARLLSKKHELHLVTFLQDKNDEKYLPELEKYFQKIHLISLPKFKSYRNVLAAVFRKEPFQVRYFHSVKMESKISELLDIERFDAVHVQHLRMAPYLANDKSTPKILDLPDAYSLYWQRRIETFSGWEKLFAQLEQKRVFRFEQILRKYNLALVCSKEDAAYLRQKHQLGNVAILPNGVDTDTFIIEEHDYRENKIILFTGNMDYAPNVDAVQYFCEELFPEISKKIKGVQFVIAGQRPVKKVLDLASDQIKVTGFVPDLSALYRTAAIVVAPLRFGAGTQNKVLEAMSMGVPVVTGKVGFEGLNIESDEGVILAKNSVEFIQQCLRLLEDDSLRKTVGKKGQQVINAHFSWHTVAGQLEKYFRDVIEQSKRNSQQKVSKIN